MEYKVYPENSYLSLTPESKIDSWIKKIHEMAKKGNVIKLYADTETTGLEYSNRGRPIYDPVLERKSLTRDAMSFGLDLKDLEKEAKELAGKVDRIIEIAFVACYTNKNGETYPLLDDEGEQIYFHEMINPNRYNVLPENKALKKMPMVPYEVHKTSFEFLNGEEVHPFLNIKLPKSAPSTAEAFSNFKRFFEYEDDSIFDNIIVLFHNGDEFDIPFINSEINRLPEIFNGLTLRDYAQVYDSLTLIRKILPNPIQKLIAYNQWEEIYGGNPEIKKDKDLAISGTSKSLDNLIRIARYLQNFDLEKAYNYQNQKQMELCKNLKNSALSKNIKIWDSMLEYMNTSNIEIDLLDGADKEFLKSEKSLTDEYKKFRTSLSSFNKHMEECLSYKEILHNLKNLKFNIDNNKDLKTNINEINKIGREAHGAKVDSMLFMYAFTIIENSLYKNQRMVNELKITEEIKLPEIALLEIKKKSEPNETNIKETVENLIKKNDDKIEKPNNITRLKI